MVSPPSNGRQNLSFQFQQVRLVRRTARGQGSLIIKIYYIVYKIPDIIIKISYIKY